MDLKQQTIDEIQNMLLQKADELRKDKEMTPADKLERLNVILNTYKVLENFDELEPTLKKFFDEKARKEKFEREK